jgi:hypothetical protein
MFTHLFPAHRNEHDNPESFLTIAGAILTALVIIIALAAAATVAY